MDGKEFMERLRKEISKAVVGKDDVIELLTVALLSEGHVLIEGIPGVAKTTIAKAFANAIGLSFSRVQLTPDLLPADIIGVVYYDQKTGQWRTKKGPIFANIVLADEVNRAQPKTQSALLEAMQERQVTIEGTTHTLPEPFLVIATMNPLEHEGVYVLPEAQLDRFLLKIEIGFPDREEEISLLKRKSLGEFYDVEPIVTHEELIGLIGEVKRVKVSDEVIEYIYSLVSATRADERLLFGASPRAGEHLLFASKAAAFLDGRDYVIPDDVKKVAVPVLVHRLLLKAEYELEGIRVRDVILDVLRETEIPV
ncbi:AAA family ATPase [Thermococcus thioreducens]|uniref:Magnesium chelatase n=1 Tax=Thermococcus thioreducens TaxID=277988 RepID=A0A0Q2MQ75_9EURY|nr:MoxR family ATPase [Thermococcus thioreducens]ASJ11571.1 magnesium chelatase [Thermococcus thioreducens]KQH81823.1 magnesium chelatase [Thermococcus thioreducens]SEW04257.1 MoxR-like ATPase [Thermococcus thioreducens]